MAYPSMALLSKSGTSKVARWESANTQPSASGKATSMTCEFSSAARNKKSSAFSIGIKAEDIQYILKTRPLFYNGRRGQVTNYKSQVSSLKQAAKGRPVGWRSPLSFILYLFLLVS